MNKFNKGEFNGRRSMRGNRMGYGQDSETVTPMGGRGVGRGNRGMNPGFRCVFRDGTMDNSNDIVSKEETLQQEVTVLQERLDDIKRELENSNNK